jgi:hypothetical protein
MEVTFSQAKPMLVDLLRAGLVPMMEGSPGIGKSALVKQVAKEFNLKVIDLRLSQCDPTDLLGFPNSNGKKSFYVPMDTFPLRGDPLPADRDPVTNEITHQYDGWLLFLDEFTTAGRSVQAASYKITLDQMVGQDLLHERCKVICAGNKETDGAIVEPMSTALQSRLAHMELVLSVPEWIDHAYESDFDHRITDYIKFKNSQLYTFEPDHTDKTYACPRTWEFATRILKILPDISSDHALRMLASVLSEGVAREFRTYCKIYKELPKIEDILKRPNSVPISTEPSVLWALTGTLANNVKTETIDPIMDYVGRLPREFQVITVREIQKRSPGMQRTPAMARWIAENQEKMY